MIGIISDTHNLLRSEALRALRRCELIVHAGDVCRPDVLETLSDIAPVACVRGNNDRGAFAKRVPESRLMTVGGFRLFVTHDVKSMTLDPAEHGIDVVVSGHSHRPEVRRRQRVLYVNPGSAGPRRFALPVSIARLSLARSTPRATIVELVSEPPFDRIVSTGIRR